LSNLVRSVAQRKAVTSAFQRVSTQAAVARIFPNSPAFSTQTNAGEKKKLSPAMREYRRQQHQHKKERLAMLEAERKERRRLAKEYRREQERNNLAVMRERRKLRNQERIAKRQEQLALKREKERAKKQKMRTRFQLVQQKEKERRQKLKLRARNLRLRLQDKERSIKLRLKEKKRQAQLRRRPEGFPVRPRSAYILYYKSLLGKNELSGEGVAQKAAQAAKQWKGLSDDQKKTFVDQANNDKKRYENEKAEFLKTYIPPPKRPLAAYTLFCKQELSENKPANLSEASERMKSIASKWRTMSAEAKAPFVKESDKQRQAYAAKKQ